MTADVLRAAVELQQFCADRRWQFCIIGGLAVARWGQPRFTEDVDISLLTGFGQEEAFADRLLERFRPRMNDAREFALRNRVLLLATEDGVALDVAFGGFPFEERSVARASDFELADGVVLRTCSAEDLIVLKVFAGRDRDWIDVHDVLIRQRGKVDVALVKEELRPLLDLKGTPEALERFEKLLADSVS